MSDSLSQMEVYEFDDLTPKTVPFRVGGDWFLLLEPSEDVAVRWRNSQIRAAKVSSGKVVGIGDVADSEPTLISLCLYRAVLDDGTKPPRDTAPDLLRLPRAKDGSPDPGKRVPVTVIRSWPAPVAKAMFREAMEIGELNEPDSKQRAAVLAAFGRDDAPAPLGEVRSWVDSLVADDARKYGPLEALFREGDDPNSTRLRSAAKNGRSPTAPTSDWPPS